jgi:hypothetical protein
LIEIKDIPENKDTIKNATPDKVFEININTIPIPPDIKEVKMNNPSTALLLICGHGIIDKNTELI